MQALLDKLDAQYRTPLILRYWEEYSYDEIAQTMDISVSAVKSRLFRARKQMAALYRQEQAAVNPPSSGDPLPTRSGRRASGHDQEPTVLQAAMAGI